MQVKMFGGNNRDQVAKEINAWMSDKKPQVEGVEQSESAVYTREGIQHNLTISVWYIQSTADA